MKPAESPPDRPRAPLAHVGRVGELALISLLNLALKALTLGLYHFWAKTRVRRYVWRHTSYAREPFEYTGRGHELLLGFVLAMGLLAVLGGLLEGLSRLAGRDPLPAALVGVAGWPLLAYLGGWGRYASRRYLLARTRWRGLRFALGGRARDHGLRMLAGSVLALLSAGLYLPVLRNRLAAHLVNTAWCGGQRFGYDGRSLPLLRRFLSALALALAVTFAWGLLLVVVAPLLLTPPELTEPAWAPLRALALPGWLALLLPALWLAWLWYRAGELRHLVGHTRLGGARFALDLSTGRYLWMHAGNVAALLLTFGLAYPWVVVRTARTLTRSLRQFGEVTPPEAELAAAGGPPMGEGLADLLDLGPI